MTQRNIQILLETMTRCAGNCSGCALSSVERMDTTFDFETFISKTQIVFQKLEHIVEEDVESITLFLGQGDHFLMKNEDIEPFMKACSDMVPDRLKAKTVVFITASAIGKYENIKEKMDKFYDLSLIYKLPFFVQVVFDPKKMTLTQKFQEVYIKNILYFKEKCGMTEVTVNMGEDLCAHMTPYEFHTWIKTYQFKHIEMNWVNNQFTQQMWQHTHKEMFDWLQQWLLIYLEEPVYEINFIPFLSRHFNKKDINLIKMKDHIKDSFVNNTYIDNRGQQFPSQMGLISNLTPLEERLSESHFNPDTATRKVISLLVKNPACNSCEYQSVCAVSGSTSWFKSSSDTDCPWDIKEFLSFFEKNILNTERTKTVFDRNPVQHEQLINNSETHHYFEKTFSTILNKPTENQNLQNPNLTKSFLKSNKIISIQKI